MRAGWMKSSFPPLPEWTQVDSHCTSIGLSSGSSMIQRFWLGATPVPVLGSWTWLRLLDTFGGESVA